MRLSGGGPLIVAHELEIGRGTYFGVFELYSNIEREFSMSRQHRPRVC